MIENYCSHLLKPSSEWIYAEFINTEHMQKYDLELENESHFSFLNFKLIFVNYLHRLIKIANIIRNSKYGVGRKVIERTLT